MREQRRVGFNHSLRASSNDAFYPRDREIRKRKIKRKWKEAYIFLYVLFFIYMYIMS